MASKAHPSITAERITELAEESMFGMESNGICLACGEDAYGVEPDAVNYTCESCGAKKVVGAEELVLLVAYGGLS